MTNYSLYKTSLGKYCILHRKYHYKYDYGKMLEITLNNISIYEYSSFFASVVCSELVIDRTMDIAVELNDITIFSFLCGYYAKELEFQLYNMPFDFQPLHNILMKNVI